MQQGVINLKESYPHLANKKNFKSTKGSALQKGYSQSPFQSTGRSRVCIPALAYFKVQHAVDCSQEGYSLDKATVDMHQHQEGLNINSRIQTSHHDICKAAEYAEDVEELYLSQDFEKFCLSEGLPKSEFGSQADVTALKLDEQVLPLIMLLHPI